MDNSKELISQGESETVEFKESLRLKDTIGDRMLSWPEALKEYLKVCQNQ